MTFLLKDGCQGEATIRAPLGKLTACTTTKDINSTEPKIDHLGLQTDDSEAFDFLREQLLAANGEIFDQPEVRYCCVNSTKAWVGDPDGGISWETFQTRSAAASYDSGCGERHGARGAGAAARIRAAE